VLKDDLKNDNNKISRLFKEVVPKIQLKRQASHEGLSNCSTVLGFDTLQSAKGKTAQQASGASVHELNFLYRRVADYQRAMDEILRLPYTSEFEVREIIGKVYVSHATKVSNKQL
jgi:hypothetical protein